MSKLFPPEIVRQAFLRAKGRCECEQMNCTEHGRTPRTLSMGDPRCSRTFYFPERGEKWKAHARNPEGPYTLENCEILCLQCALDKDSQLGKPSTSEK